MIKAVIIDDEVHALNELELLLNEYKFIRIVGRFQNPIHAIEEIEELDPHVVFLDIDMPLMSGVVAADKIIDVCPDVKIVFSTAYNNYALDAFELSALDYLMKPLSFERFQRTIKKITDSLSIADDTAESENSKKLRIRTLGKFEVGLEGREPIKWRTERVKELFGYLLHNANKEVSKEVIFETLYPNLSLKAATHSLHNNIYYIKKALLDYGIDNKTLDLCGKYMLKVDEHRVDHLILRQLLQELSTSSNAISVMEKINECYTGDYFEGMDWRWADMERTELTKKYSFAAIELAKYYTRHDENEKAEQILQKMYAADPYQELVTIMLLKIYAYTGRRDLAIKHYTNYKKMLRNDLGMLPSEESRKIIKAIKIDLL